MFGERKEEVLGRVRRCGDKLIDGGLKRPETEDDMDELYAEVLEELAIPQVKRIYDGESRCRQKVDPNQTATKVKYTRTHLMRRNSNETAPYWIDILGQKGWNGKPKMNVTQAREMMAVIRTSHKDFLENFVQGGGPAAMLKVTKAISERNPKNPSEFALIEALVACFKALMNNDVGMDGVLDVESALSTIANCFELGTSDRTHVDSEIVTLLAVTCFFSKRGRNAVLRAMEDFRVARREMNMYQSIVTWFKDCENNDFRAAVATFITAIVNLQLMLEVASLSGTTFCPRYPQRNEGYHG